MAKTSMVNREVKRAKLVKRTRRKRAKLKEIIRKTTTSTPAEREAGCSSVAGTAARFEQEPPAQPLRDHRSPARRLPQVRSGPH